MSPQQFGGMSPQHSQSSPQPGGMMAQQPQAAGTGGAMMNPTMQQSQTGVAMNPGQPLQQQPVAPTTLYQCLVKPTEQAQHRGPLQAHKFPAPNFHIYVNMVKTKKNQIHFG